MKIVFHCFAWAVCPLWISQARLTFAHTEIKSRQKCFFCFLLLFFFQMFDLVSFPIIPALLVSPKPLAQSWSPRFKNTHTCEHTHVYLCKETHMHEELDTREHTFLSHDSGSRPPASGELPGYLQHLELAVLVYRRTKWGREREMEQRPRLRVGSKINGGGGLQREWWETFGQDIWWRG